MIDIVYNIQVVAEQQWSGAGHKQSYNIIHLSSTISIVRRGEYGKENYRSSIKDIHKEGRGFVLYTDIYIVLLRRKPNRSALTAFQLQDKGKT